MNKLFTVIALALICTAATAQTDSTAKGDTVISPAKTDTIRVGNIVIVTDGSKHHDDYDSDNIKIEFGRNKEKNMSNVSTDWFIFDFGFENFIDNTNYAEATAGQYLVNAPGTTYPLGPNDFKLNSGKSINVNIWFFMQRLNLVQHRLNLVYGLGIEFNNFVFNSNISFKQAGYTPYSNDAIPHPYVIRDSISFSKNKLATNYVTIPLMLNYTTKPGYRNRGLNVSAGVSLGYSYNSRNKQKSPERGNLKNFGDYGIQQFQFAYIAELGFGPVKLYGSYTPGSIFESGLDLKSYAIGIRLGFW